MLVTPSPSVPRTRSDPLRVARQVTVDAILDGPGIPPLPLTDTLDPNTDTHNPSTNTNLDPKTDTLNPNTWS
jgi:hypothetical protein